MAVRHHRLDHANTDLCNGMHKRNNDQHARESQCPCKPVRMRVWRVQTHTVDYASGDGHCVMSLADRDREQHDRNGRRRKQEDVGFPSKHCDNEGKDMSLVLTSTLSMLGIMLWAVHGGLWGRRNDNGADDRDVMSETRRRRRGGATGAVRTINLDLQLFLGAASLLLPLAEDPRGSANGNGNGERRTHASRSSTSVW